MSKAAPLYRTTKTRNAKSQEQLRSSLLHLKYSSTSRSTDASSHQTYMIPLPNASVSLLYPVVSGLTGRMEVINRDRRNLHTIGIWRESSSAIYRCCFVQPEVSSATCSFAATWSMSARLALESVTADIPDAVPCALSASNRLPQLSGRMTPYVADRLPFSTVSWGFANISGSYLIFLKTDGSSGQSMLVPCKEAVEIMKHHFPKYSVCVSDIKTNSHKVTVAPSDSRDINSANKNTCMFIYGDGSFRLQGKPAAMERVCMSVREAIHSVMSSSSSSSFLSRLCPIRNV